jgi:glycerophosphoryl diester phosphodiesterase
MKTTRYIAILLAALTFTSNTTAVNAANRVTVIAHRGASDTAPEETMSAFDIAIKQKSDFIEMDLRRTKDNKLVLMHDDTVDRTTNGKGRVSTLTLAQLKKLDAGSKFNQKFKNERIITMDEVVKRFGTKTNYFIETRTINGKTGMELPLLHILNQAGLINKRKVTIESWSADSLKIIHSHYHYMPLVQLAVFNNKNQITQKQINEWKKYASGVGLEASMIDKQTVKKLHDNHLKVYVFFFQPTLEKAEQKRVIADGADAVFTNHVSYTNSIIK